MFRPDKQNILATLEEEFTAAKKIECCVARFTALEKVYKKVDARVEKIDNRLGLILAIGIPSIAAIGFGASSVITALTAGTAAAEVAKIGVLTAAGSGFIAGAASVRLYVAGEILKSVTSSALSLLPENLETGLRSGWRTLMGGPSYSSKLRTLHEKIESLMNTETDNYADDLIKSKELQSVFTQHPGLENRLKKAFIAEAIKQNKEPRKAAKKTLPIYSLRN